MSSELHHSCPIAVILICSSMSPTALLDRAASALSRRTDSASVSSGQCKSLFPCKRGLLVPICKSEPLTWSFDGTRPACCLPPPWCLAVLMVVGFGATLPCVVVLLSSRRTLLTRQSAIPQNKA